MTTIKSAKLTASDLMETKLIRLDHDATLEEAAAILEDAGISGAPVVDPSGKLVGVVSLRDVAQRARFKPLDRGDESNDALDDVELGEESDDAPSMADDYTVVNRSRELVRDCMSSSLITVPPSLSVREVAGRMVRERIHRVFVVEGHKLLGVISTFDLARAVAEDRI